MAARSVTKLTILALSLSALLAQSPLAQAQSQTSGKPTAGLGEIVNAVTKAPASKVTLEPSRQAIYPSFSRQLDSIFAELLRRPSALTPSPHGHESGPTAKGLTAMLERARQPQAAQEDNPPSFSLDELVTQSMMAGSADFEPSNGAERSRRHDLVDALRVAVPSDGDILR